MWFGNPLLSGLTTSLDNVGLPEGNVSTSPDAALPNSSNYFAHTLLRARAWQHRPEFDQVCDWWRQGGYGVCALVGMGGAGKTAIVDRFLHAVPGVMPNATNLEEAIETDVSLPRPQGVFVYSFYDDHKPENFFRELQVWLEGNSAPEKHKSPAQLKYDIQQKRGLVVIDGLEMVQDSDVRGGIGKLTSPSLHELLNHIACGSARELSVLVTSRFPLSDLQYSEARFFQAIAVEEIDVVAAVSLLRERGVHGPDVQLEMIVEQCGRHALTIDLAGGYIKEYGDGAPTTSLNLGMTEGDEAEVELEPDVDRRAVLRQEIRFTRIAERYREAMLKTDDEATLALLERLCLFRLGVDCETLAEIFTGSEAERVSGKALAGLRLEQLERRLAWLVHMRIVEHMPDQSRSGSDQNSTLTMYSIHPAVRDGFVKGISRNAASIGHRSIQVALERNLERMHSSQLTYGGDPLVHDGEPVILSGQPGENPSDPATLDLLEEIIYHTLQSGHIEEAWDIYQNRIGGFRNLGWRLGAYERGERICRAFSGGYWPEALPLEDGWDVTAPENLSVKNGSQSLATVAELPLKERATLINGWGLYLMELGRLVAARTCFVTLLDRDRRDRALSDASISSLLASRVYQLTGHLKAALAQATQAISLADKSENAQCHAYSYEASAPVRALLGCCEDSLADFRMCLRLQHEVEPFATSRPLWSLRGVYYTSMLLRLHRNEEARKLGAENKAIMESSSFENYVAHCNLVLADLPGERCQELCWAAREWAETRDAKELRCWCSLVQVRMELRNIAGCKKGDHAEKIEEGLAIDCLSHLTDGLKIARDCGYSLYHIDLLLERARVHLLRRDPSAALEDINLALDTGVPADEETGQPELLAANDEECGYAWAIPVGLQLRAEGTLLQAAETLQRTSFDPAQPDELPADVRQSTDRARELLQDALDRWHELRDPEPTEGNNFKLDGKEYNCGAAETYEVLAQLQSGLLTRYPPTSLAFEPVKSTPSRESENSEMSEVLSLDAIRGKIDFAIITVREDEFEAVLKRFSPRQTIDGGKQLYELCRFANGVGKELSAAIVRSPGQGPSSAQSVTRDVIHDLDPSWLILAGIAGASPGNECSLGDVCLASRLNDFSVSAAIEGKQAEYQQLGGPMHREVERLLAWLPAARDRLDDWNSESSIGLEKPKLDIPHGLTSKSLYGSRGARRSTLTSLKHHFSVGGLARPPRFHIGPGATAGVLVKDTELLQRWQESARHLTHVEMEAGGVYEAARKGGRIEYPLLCVRGISDVVGFKRDAKWTEFACHSAAAFVRALLAHAPINP